MPDLRPILLVEDDQNDIDLTLEALTHNQLANPIIVLRDGAEALDYLRLGKPGQPPMPAVMLLDLKMPKVDGLEVLRQVRQDPQLRALPVIVLTVSRDEGDRLASERLGIEAYLVKPVSVAPFISAAAALGLQWGILDTSAAESRTA